MNRNEAIEFGKASAAMALDQAGSHDSLQDAADTYRENVRETLKSEYASEYETEAFAAFDTVISATLPDYVYGTL